jgi:hypothetical protein
VDVQAPLYVVSAVSADDGVGGQAVTTYKYEGARAHVQGRGFEGFAAMQATDAVTGVVTRTEFRQDHPYTGQVATSETYLPSGGDKIFISRLNNAWAVKSLNGGATQAPYVATSTAESFEINDGVQFP